MQKSREGRTLEYIAYPMGGIGAGMLCLEGTGAFGEVSIRNAPSLFCEPNMFAAVAVKGEKVSARVLEGQVPGHKIYSAAARGDVGAGNGMRDKNYGLPRFRSCAFSDRFPFPAVSLSDCTMPFDVEIEGFSPFIPADADSSSMPAASVTYTFKSKSDSNISAVFYFTAMQFMGIKGGEDSLFVKPIKNGFVLEQEAFGEDKSAAGAFAVVCGEDASVNTDFYRGGWWDTFTMRWNTIAAGAVSGGRAQDNRSGGGAIELPFTLEPGAERSITISFAWYVPQSGIRFGADLPGERERGGYSPWYAGKYGSVLEVAEDFAARRGYLYGRTKKFSDALYETRLPGDTLEAVAANLTILKSPTLLRQQDGRLWGWEGCQDSAGSCHGSCTHVWNYAQALPHLFPALERTFREVEFNEDMDERGHQQFRTSLPIRKNSHDFHAAADGQLGGIMKMYREWRVSGDTGWIASYWDKLCLSMEYCIRTWDKKEEGVLREPHHNTYDIEFWGAEPMCETFYLGALKAMCAIGEAVRRDTGRYSALYARGRAFLETELWNGEYFCQLPEWKTLSAEFDDRGDPILIKEGPKYQYGSGCLSDGVLGAWLAKECGLGDIISPEKTKSHLLAVYKYNFRRELYDHANPQRPGYALGKEGGLLLCSWPHGGKPSFPFVYSDEVWTGIEYQVASHLASFGCASEAGSIVSALRARYDGERRNPFDEYECGHWYARALASYGLLDGYTAVRYDAVSKTLYAGKGDYAVFLATETGCGVVESKGGKPELRLTSGYIDVRSTVIV